MPTKGLYKKKKSNANPFIELCKTLYKIILKFLQRSKHSRIGRTFLKNYREQGIFLQSIRSYEIIVSEVMWYWSRDFFFKGPMEHNWSNEIYPYIYETLVYHRNSILDYRRKAELIDTWNRKKSYLFIFNFWKIIIFKKMK